MTTTTTELPARHIAAALVEAMLPAGEQIPAADVDTVCDTVAGYLEEHPVWARALASSLVWLEGRAVLSTGKRFTRLSHQRRADVLQRLSTKAVSGNLLRALAAPFKLAWMLDAETQKRVGNRPAVEVPSQIEQFRWQHQVSSAADLDGDEELEADVVIVGTGAGGAAAAYELASRGLAVVMIEEGDYLNRKDFSGELTKVIPRLYRGMGATTAVGNVTIPVPVGKGVGGTTTINSGTCMRTPANVLARWRNEFGLTGFTEDNLDSVFAGVEEVLCVEQADPRYVGEIGNVIADGARKLGYSQLHPLRRNARGCDGQGLCQFGCPTDAKQSTNVSYVPRALDRGAFLFTGLRAQRLVRNGHRVDGVEATGTNAAGKPVTLRIRAARTIIAMGTFMTPLFLQDNGVRSAHLGRHLTIHPAGVVNALFPDRDFGNSRTIPQGFGMADLASEGLMFEGGTIPFIGHGLFSNFYGERFVRFCEQYQQTAYFGFMIRDTSEGRVRKGPHRDVPWISYNMNDHDFGMFLKGIDILSRIYLAAGAEKVLIPGLTGLTAIDSEKQLDDFLSRRHKPRDFLMSAYHPLGTARLSANPDKGVCDPDHRVHGWQGLYVMDGSNVPTSLGANPQVTIMAMAARAAATMAETINQ
jgi:choline dehydrogenase-like flavoprotein